jgi:hypothetical protein
METSIICYSMYSITVGFLPSPLKNQRKLTPERQDCTVAEHLVRLACVCRKYLSVKFKFLQIVYTTVKLKKKS